MENKNLLPIGTKVFDIRFGWGVVESVTNSLPYPIIVQFVIENCTYTENGSLPTIDNCPTLSLSEYNLVSGGFTSITDLDKPKVGYVGYFWDYEGDFGGLLYSKLINITDDGKYESLTRSIWMCFSKNIPEWFTKKMENE